MNVDNINNLNLTRAILVDDNFVETKAAANQEITLNFEDDEVSIDEDEEEEVIEEKVFEIDEEN